MRWRRSSSSSPPARDRHAVGDLQVDTAFVTPCRYLLAATSSFQSARIYWQVLRQDSRLRWGPQYRRICTIAGEVATSLTLSYTIKPPGEPLWNPNSPLPPLCLSISLFLAITGGSHRSFAGCHRWRAPRAPWRCPGEAPPSGDDLSKVMHQGKD
jgi:hypothetical protein